MTTIKLGVNVDHVATIRQSRLTAYPDPVQAALIATRAGADSITVHLREDRRHIQDHDVKLLKQTLDVPLNLEMAVTEEMLVFAEQTRPTYCCLVPERRQELTTEGGLDVLQQKERVRQAVKRLQQAGCQVSLFIDADAGQIDAAAWTGADMIEIHTGTYADAKTESDRLSELDRIKQGMALGSGHHLQLNAGHGLHYDNVQAIVALPGLVELNIGHAIIARAMFCGMEQAVKEMRGLLDQSG
ncbi:MAG: pyridoxine 5'-phosphate synthase [Gammaproteobacteria bacterium]